MRKRKINPQYLLNITSREIKSESIDSYDFASSIKKFAEEYLGGIMELNISGTSKGCVKLILPVTTYLVRLLCECGDGDELIEADISLKDELTMSVTYKGECPVSDVSEIVKVARLAGFKVERNENTLIFKTEVITSPIMQIYAMSNEDFYNLLVITYKM